MSFFCSALSLWRAGQLPSESQPMPTKAKKPANANDFYAELGGAIRLARITAGKSQTEVGDHIGVSFQQVQKTCWSRFPRRAGVSSISSDAIPAESYLLRDSRHSTDHKPLRNVRLNCAPNRPVESALCRRVADRHNRRGRSLNQRSRCHPW